MDLKIVENNVDWDTSADRQALIRWFAPDLLVNVTHDRTYFQSVPFETYERGRLGISPAWYDQNVSPLGRGFDMILFAVNESQWQGERERGWRTDRSLGPIELHIRAERNGRLRDPTGADLGSTYFNYARHEILHGLFMMAYGDEVVSGRPGDGAVDTTHFWWDRNNLDQALSDWRQADDVARLRIGGMALGALAARFLRT